MRGVGRRVGQCQVRARGPGCTKWDSPRQLSASAWCHSACPPPIHPPRTRARLRMWARPAAAPPPARVGSRASRCAAGPAGALPALCCRRPLAGCAWGEGEQGGGEGGVACAAVGCLCAESGAAPLGRNQCSNAASSGELSTHLRSEYSCRKANACSTARWRSATPRLADAWLTSAAAMHSSTSGSACATLHARRGGARQQAGLRQAGPVGGCRLERGLESWQRSPAASQRPLWSQPELVPSCLQLDPFVLTGTHESIPPAPRRTAGQVGSTAGGVHSDERS